MTADRPNYNEGVPKWRRPACLDIIVRARAPSGGWGAYVTTPTEPFDTAVVVLALAGLLEEPTLAAPGLDGLDWTGSSWSILLRGGAGSCSPHSLKTEAGSRRPVRLDNRVTRSTSRPLDGQRWCFWPQMTSLHNELIDHEQSTVVGVGLRRVDDEGVALTRGERVSELLVGQDPLFAQARVKEDRVALVVVVPEFGAENSM